MDLNELQSEIVKLELNLEKVLKLPKSNQEVVIKLYNDLLDCFYGNKGSELPGGFRIDYIRACLNYNTLVNNDYLVTKREAAIDKVLS